MTRFASGYLRLHENHIIVCGDALEVVVVYLPFPTSRCHFPYHLNLTHLGPDTLLSATLRVIRTPAKAAFRLALSVW